MFLTIIILPLIGSIIAGTIARKIGVNGAQYITTFSVIIAAIISYFAYYEVAILNNTVHTVICNWVTIGILDVKWAITFDTITVSILIVVLTISALVHLFSIDYIANDPHNQRFFSNLSLFTGSILVLVVADNFLILFVGWEAIGISSYLLIGFWYTRTAANKSAIKALIINRIGDIAFTLSIVCIYSIVSSYDISIINMIAPIINPDGVTVIGILLLLAAIGKSAQYGLHTWLPDAMNGPTPVSALIHAATLVTAGVYLLIRSSAILEHSSTVQISILFIGATTAFFAASTGLVQNDIKTVIAYSTCSQIGYIFIAVGISQYDVALFHLINHAFFKAILFLSAGAIIHATIDQQDIRKIGGIIAFLPFSYSSIIVASLSLIALPFITGYYSKDLILELAYGQYHFSSIYAYLFGTITAGLTAFYSIRLLSITFITTANGFSNKLYNNIHESSIIVIIPLIILSVFAVFFGYISSDLYVGLGSDSIANCIYIHPNHITHVDAEFISIFYKLLPLLVTLFFGSFSVWVYHYQYNLLSQYITNSSVITIYNYLFNKWNIDIIYNHYISYVLLNLGYNISKILDRGVIEQIGPFGIASMFISISNNIATIDTGNITDYALYLGIAIIIITSLIISTVYYPIIGIDITTIIIGFAVLFLYNSNKVTSLSI